MSYKVTIENNEIEFIDEEHFKTVMQDYLAYIELFRTDESLVTYIQSQTFGYRSRHLEVDISGGSISGSSLYIGDNLVAISDDGTWTSSVTADVSNVEGIAINSVWGDGSGNGSYYASMSTPLMGTQNLRDTIREVLEEMSQEGAIKEKTEEKKEDFGPEDKPTKKFYLLDFEE